MDKAKTRYRDIIKPHPDTSPFIDAFRSVSVSNIREIESNVFIQTSGIVHDSIVDGPGIRMSVFTQGCPHKCNGCHNTSTHAFTGGTASNVDNILRDYFSNPLYDGITISGGEPFCQPAPVAELARRVKERGHSVIIYTGYTFEHLVGNPSAYAILKNTDCLIDGLFINSLKSLDLSYRGSTNQRIIDVRMSIIQERVIEISL